MNEMLSMFDHKLVLEAVLESFKRLGPRHQLRNPVMFVVWLGSVLCTGLAVQALVQRGEEPAWFVTAITLWLWFTVLFANFAEALAEGRSKAQAASLRGLKKAAWAKKLAAPQRYGAAFSTVESSDLRKGDVVLVEAGDTIPADGEVIDDGIAHYACEIKNGTYYDTGDKLEYLKTVVDFGLRHEDMGDALRNYLRERLES